jgi:hypothetical protein
VELAKKSMVEQNRAETITDVNFKLLSVAALIKKVHNGISIEHLYSDAERKFDTLVELLTDVYTDDTAIAKFGYSLDELKQMSLLIFTRLISDINSDPYMTLCVLEGASLEEIKRRRNKLLYIFHPDRNQNEFINGTITRKLNEAYKIIANEYNKANKTFRYIKTNVPRYYPEKKMMRFIFFLLIVIFILVFFGFMKTYYFF